jgi:hypothetical protein
VLTQVSKPSPRSSETKSRINLSHEKDRDKTSAAGAVANADYSATSSGNKCTTVERVDAGAVAASPSSLSVPPSIGDVVFYTILMSANARTF